MIVAIPFLEGQKQHPEIAKLILKYASSFNSHRLYLAYEKGKMQEAEEYVDKIKPAFGMYEIAPLPACRQRDLNSRMNSAFAHTAGHMLNTISGQWPRAGFLWFDPTLCTPTQPGWLDDLDQEYMSTGMPYMGSLQTKYNKFEDEWNAEGSYLDACSIYNVGLSKASTMIDFLSEPFEHEIMYEIGKMSADTCSISVNRNSSEYYTDKEDGIIMRSDDGNDIQHPDSYSGPMPDDCVLHVGCWDGSLAKILLDA